MKIKSILTYALGGLMIAFAATSCKVDHLENPNDPTVPPTFGILNKVQKSVLDNTRGSFSSGRQYLLWVQYWNQTAYTEEDRYQYRETTNQGYWDAMYANAQDLKDLIMLNTNESTKNAAAAYGSNENQIAVARIMLVYTYLQAVELWGDVPYWSYGGTNESFQANSVSDKEITFPAYATQQDIYADMLSELKAAAAQITGDYTMDGDNFYGGDAAKWKKFANSLRLRIANRIKGVYPAASTHITEALAGGVFEGNMDNAGVTYETSDNNAAPMYRAFYVNNREDHAPSASFVALLEGNPINGTGTYNGVVDPRLEIFVDLNGEGNRVGIPLTSSNGEVNTFKWWSYPGEANLQPDKTLYYMEYSEVCFIQSELNGWDQTWYENGVRASMEKWGVDAADITTYIANLPAATMETVLTEKYKALYMQPMEAWSEYRRTGYPNTLIKQGSYSYTWKIGEAGVDLRDTTATFTFGADLADLPTRNGYPLNEASVNGVNLDKAISSNGGDTQSTKLWWMP